MAGLSKNNAELIVALDVDTLSEVRALVEKLSPAVDIFKIGSRLFTACGPAAVRFVQAKGKRVFLDLKYHDIPNTVAGAVRTAVGLTKAVERSSALLKNSKVKPTSLFMLTVHTIGGVEMMRAAAQAGAKAAQEFRVTKPLIVGVTVLTSEAKRDNIHTLVLERARLAQEAGLDGVVASVQEAQLIREELGPDFVIVTPGIRPAGAEAGDQKRVATPKEAVKNGSNYLVVGRPVLDAPDPLKAAKDIIKEMKS